MGQSEAGAAPDPAVGAVGVAAWLDRPVTALAAYLVATLAGTFPLAFHLQSRVPLGAADVWQNLWNFWWWKTALFELWASPYWTAHLYHPDGISLAFHTHSPLNVLATLPVSLLFGIEAAYNTAILVGFWGAGFCTWLLARYLGCDPRAAFVAGLIYAFAPMHFEQSLEHLNLASIQFIPLVVYFVLRLLREGGRRNVVGAGLCLAADALVCWQFGLLSVPIVAVLALWQAWGPQPVRPRWPLLRDLASAGALALALVLPFAWSLLSGALAGGPLKEFENTASDPVFWLLPSDHNPLLGWLVRDLYAEFRAYAAAGFLSYLGFVPLGLALFATFRSQTPHRVFWGAWVVVFLAFSLGKHPLVLGHVYDGILLPHALLEDLPILGRLRIANRFGLFALLGIAVLAGAGFDALLRAGRGRLAAGLLVLLGVEYLWLPYPTQPLPSTAHLEALGPIEGAVLTLPFPVGPNFSQAMYEQTRHGHPMVGGYLSYPPGDESLRAITGMPLLRSYAFLRPAQGTLQRGQLERLGIGGVVVHRDWGKARLARLAAGEVGDDVYQRRAALSSRGYPDALLDVLLAECRRALGPPVYETDDVVVFRLTPQ